MCFKWNNTSDYITHKYNSIFLEIHKVTNQYTHNIVGWKKNPATSDRKLYE